MALASTSAVAQSAAFAIAAAPAASSANVDRVSSATSCRFCPLGCIVRDEKASGGARLSRNLSVAAAGALFRRSAPNFTRSSSSSSSSSAVVRASADASPAVADTPVQTDSSNVDQETKTYHFLVANSQFMLDEEEHFQEQLKERIRHFKDVGRVQDFWLVHEPAFLDSMPEIAKRITRPCTALVSTDGAWITFMKLRLDRVLRGEFKAPSENIPDAFVSKAAIGDFEVQSIEKWMAPYPKYASKWWEPFLHQ